MRLSVYNKFILNNSSVLIYLIDIVIESLENYRSLGSVFPLQKSNLFEYLPPSNHFLLLPMTENHIPTFTSPNNRRIDLTPGVTVSFRHYRRLPSSINSHKHFSKPVIQKLRSKPIRKERQSIVPKVTTKLYREHLSHQITELIRTNNKPIRM